MAELEKEGVYACSLSMPSPSTPNREEWVMEIARNINRNRDDELFLVGHSLGVAAVLNYLQSAAVDAQISGVVLVAGRCIKVKNPILESFYSGNNFEEIRKSTRCFAVIHGDNDPVVPFQNGEQIAESLEVQLIVVPSGGHLGGRDGWYELPQCLEALHEMFTGEI